MNRTSGLVRFTSVQTRKTGGFTLIELLVVIAIIAILAAIIFPIFSQVRGAALKTASLSNTRQIGLAMQMYINDTDSRYPISFYGTGAASTPRGWPVLLQPYIKSTDVFIQPGGNAARGTPPGTPFPVHYAYNYYVGGNTNAVLEKTTSQINNPSRLVLFVDSGTRPALGVAPEDWPLEIHPTLRYTAWLLVHAGSNLLPPPTMSYNFGGPIARWNGKTNIIWADTHATHQSIESFYTLPGQEVDFRPPGVTPNWSPCLDPSWGCP